MAIATIYRGIEYRSRLEARWAAFFDHLGWNFTYEPFDGDGYIPDFVIHGAHPLLIEVKPAITASEYQEPVAKVTSGVARHWSHDILIVGLSPITMGIPNSWGTFSAGLLGEADGVEWDFAAALWMTCGKCGDVVVHHDYQSYAGRPCGHQDGDHYMGTVHLESLRAMWAEACNDAKWRGRDAESGLSSVTNLIVDRTSTNQSVFGGISELTVIGDDQ